MFTARFQEKKTYIIVRIQDARYVFGQIVVHNRVYVVAIVD